MLSLPSSVPLASLFIGCIAGLEFLQRPPLASAAFSDLQVGAFDETSAQLGGKDSNKSKLSAFGFSTSVRIVKPRIRAENLRTIVGVEGGRKDESLYRMGPQS